MFHNLNSKINFKIDKIFIDKNTFFKNFKGYVKFRNNKIETSELLSVINKKDKFKLNIKTISNNEKITKLYIDKPEPFIKNYKFIKCFKEGNLTYESISINEKSRSKLNIYNFKKESSHFSKNINSCINRHCRFVDRRRHKIQC